MQEVGDRWPSTGRGPAVIRDQSPRQRWKTIGSDRISRTLLCTLGGVLVSLDAMRVNSCRAELGLQNIGMNRSDLDFGFWIVTIKVTDHFR